MKFFLKLILSLSINSKHSKKLSTRKYKQKKKRKRKKVTQNKRCTRNHFHVLLLTFYLGFISVKEEDAVKTKNGKDESLNRFLTKSDIDNQPTLNPPAPSQKAKKRVLNVVKV
jgi:hypothetical protein